MTCDFHSSYVCLYQSFALQILLLQFLVYRSSLIVLVNLIICSFPCLVVLISNFSYLILILPFLLSVCSHLPGVIFHMLVFSNLLCHSVLGVFPEHSIGLVYVRLIWVANNVHWFQKIKGNTFALTRLQASFSCRRGWFQCCCLISFSSCDSASFSVLYCFSHDSTLATQVQRLYTSQSRERESTSSENLENSLIMG